MTTSYFLNEEIRSWFTSRSRGRARTSLKPVTFPSLASKRYFCGTELSDLSCRCRFLDRGETYSRETTLRRLRCFQMVPLTTRKCKNNRRTIFVVSRAENTRYKILFISGPDFWTLLHYFRILSKEHSPSSFFFFFQIIGNKEDKYWHAGEIRNVQEIHHRLYCRSTPLVREELQWEKCSDV